MQVQALKGELLLNILTLDNFHHKINIDLLCKILLYALYLYMDLGFWGFGVLGFWGFGASPSPGGNGEPSSLTNSVVPSTWVVAMGVNNGLSFSHDTAGVNVNLSLDAGQAQLHCPLGK